MNMELLSSGWLIEIARHLTHATLLAALTWLGCATFLRRSRPAIHAVLWTVVLLKFLVPPVIPLARSWGDLVVYFERAGRAAAATGKLSLVPDGISASAVSSGGSIWSADLVVLLLATFYGSGLLFSLTRTLRAARGERRLVDESRPAGSEISEMVQSLSRRMGIRHPPEVRITPERISPFVLGICRPKLVLPGPLFERLDIDGVAALLVHELAHVRRRDSLVRLMQATARTVFFFWPPVSWVCRQVDRAAEMACDQWAVRETRLDPERYASFLLEIVRNIRTGPPALEQLAFVSRTSLLEERFAMILNRTHQFPARLNRLMIPTLGAWTLFAIGGPSQEGGGGEPRAKVIIHLKGDPSAVSISAETLPEADADGDGRLSIAELEGFQSANPESLEFWFEKGEPSQERVEVIVRQVEGAGAPEHGVIVHSEEAPDILIDAGDLLERHPEADLNGDGFLNPDELEEIRLPEKEIRVWVDSDGDQTSTIEFIGEGEIGAADLDGDGHVSPAEMEGFLESKIGEDSTAGGRKVVFVRREVKHADGPAPDLSSEERRAQFLKDHPEADLDGDGIISREEAQRLAARPRSGGKPSSESKPDQD